MDKKKKEIVAVTIIILAVALILMVVLAPALLLKIAGRAAAVVSRATSNFYPQPITPFKPRLYSLALPTSLGSIGTQPISGGLSTYTTLSVSQAYISGQNTNGFNGQYWFAQAVLNNVGLKISATAPSANAGQSAFTNLANISQTQSDTLNIQATKNYVLYPISTGVQTTISAYQLNPYYGTVQYTDCNNNPQYPSGSQPMSSSCVFNNKPAYQSYIQACNSKPSGLPVIINNGSNQQVLNAFWPGFGGTAVLFGVPANLGFGAQLECYQYQAVPYAQVYNFGSPIYQQNVSVSLNNVQLNVNQSKQQATWSYNNGTVGFQVRLLNPQNPSPVPSSTNIGTIVYYLPNITKFNNSLQQFSGQSILISYVPTSVVSGDQSSIQTSFQNLLNGGNYYLPYLQSQLAYYNKLSTQHLVNQPSSPYQNQIISSQLGYKINGISTISTAINNTFLLTLNDSSGQFVQPTVQVISNFKFLGLNYVSASCGIASHSATPFAPSGLGSVSLTVINNGAAAGSCSAFLSFSDSNEYSTQGQQNSGTLNPGATTTFTWQTGYKSYRNTSTQSTVTYNVCATATGTGCTTASDSQTINNNCPPNTVIQNSNTCQPITSPPLVTTTSINTGGTTTITSNQLSPCVGAACSSNLIPTNIPLVAIIILVVIISVIVATVVAIALYYNNNSSGTKVRLKKRS